MLKIWAKRLLALVLILSVGLGTLPSMLSAQTADTGVNPVLFQAVKSLVAAVDQATKASVPKLRARFLETLAIFLRSFPGGQLPPQAPASLNVVLLAVRTKLEVARALARQEKSLQAESRRVLRLFESAQREGARSTAPRVRTLLRNVRQRLAQIRTAHAFAELRYPFIRNCLRSVRRDLEEARKRATSGGVGERELRRLETQFEKIRDRSAGDPKVWAVLRKGLQAQQRARAAFRKGNAELLQSHMARMKAIVKRAEALLGKDSGKAVGFEGPAQQAIEACRRQERSLGQSLAASPLGLRLLRKGKAFRQEAEDALSRGRARTSLERARLARRLFERARREAEAGR